MLMCFSTVEKEAKFWIPWVHIGGWGFFLRTGKNIRIVLNSIDTHGSVADHYFDPLRPGSARPREMVNQYVNLNLFELLQGRYGSGQSDPESTLLRSPIFIDCYSTIFISK
ncbi:Uncharacterized protein Fot_50466 [Forsythia ovata]|uniref:Uncharacterized protein n=1 Tax=Forsythia ovata TaxID=205694 RepID=A0ABD1PY83_9LAMI